MSDWSLYVIRMAGGKLYTGITTDVERRFREHVSGGPRAARALRARGPLQLVYSLAVGDHSSALKLEYAVKQLPAKVKRTMIESQPDLDTLKTQILGGS